MPGGTVHVSGISRVGPFLPNTVGNPLPAVMLTKAEQAAEQLAWTFARQRLMETLSFRLLVLEGTACHCLPIFPTSTAR